MLLQAPIIMQSIPLSKLIMAQQKPVTLPLCGKYFQAGNLTALRVKPA